MTLEVAEATSMEFHICDLFLLQASFLDRVQAKEVLGRVLQHDKAQLQSCRKARTLYYIIYSGN